MSEWLRHPQAWPVLLLVPALWLWSWLRDRRRRALIAAQLGERAGSLLPAADAQRRVQARRLHAAVLLLLLVAALEPLFGTIAANEQVRGADVVLCLDVSRSMLARDLEPDRLSAAQREIRELTKRAHGDRMALVLFAGDSVLAVPLTSDLRSLAAMADQAGPLSVARGGTDLGAALARALEALVGRTGLHETIVLMTDGEDHEGRGLALAEQCRARGIAVHCIGFGTAEGSKIAITENGVETFLRDADGNEVVTALDPASLRRLSAAAGGDYVGAADHPRPLLDLYERRIRPLARALQTQDQRQQRASRFQWPLLAAVLLWMLALLSERSR